MNQEKEKDLYKRFTYHPPDDDQAERYVKIITTAHGFSKTIVDLTPTSREQSLALTKLEEVVMWANAAIARNK